MLSFMSAFGYCWRYNFVHFFAESQSESFSATSKRMSCEEFLEQFVEDEENEIVVANFYPLSNNTIKVFLTNFFNKYYSYNY